MPPPPARERAAAILVARSPHSTSGRRKPAAYHLGLGRPAVTAAAAAAACAGVPQVKEMRRSLPNCQGVLLPVQAAPERGQIPASVESRPLEEQARLGLGRPQVVQGIRARSTA